MQKVQISLTLVNEQISAAAAAAIATPNSITAARQAAIDGGLTTVEVEEVEWNAFTASLATPPISSNPSGEKPAMPAGWVLPKMKLLRGEYAGIKNVKDQEDVIVFLETEDELHKIWASPRRITGLKSASEGDKITIELEVRLENKTCYWSKADNCWKRHTKTRTVASEIVIKEARRLFVVSEKAAQVAPDIE